jgi:hypothetical protein
MVGDSVHLDSALAMLVEDGKVEKKSKGTQVHRGEMWRNDPGRSVGKYQQCF